MFSILEIARCLGFLALLAGSGLWVASYVRPSDPSARPYKLLAAPLFGLILSPLGITILYTMGSNFRPAALISISGGRVITLAHARKLAAHYRRLNLRAASAAIFVAAVTSFFLFDSADWHAGKPTLHLLEGQDTFGYAIDADWVRTHPVTQLPKLDPSEPYSLLPHQTLRLDQRLSSFVYLALVGEYVDRSSLFSYSFAVTAAAAASVLGLAALVSGTFPIFLLVVIGASVSAFFDYGHTGFFAKILGFPSAVAVMVLTLETRKEIRAETILILLLITIGASVLHSFATAITILGLGVSGSIVFAVLRFAQRDLYGLSVEEELNSAIVVGALILAAFASTGGFGVLLSGLGLEWQHFPLGLNLPIPMEPLRLSLVTQDIDYFARPITGLRPNALVIILTLALLAQSIMAVVALKLRCRTAFALLFAPSTFILTGALFRPWGAFQLSGVSFITSVMGSAALLSSLAGTPAVESAGAPRPIRMASRPRRAMVVCAVLAVVSISARLPRFLETAEFFAINPPPGIRYDEEDFQNIEREIGGRPVLIDLDGAYYVPPLMVELGRVGIKMEFSGRAWRTLANWGLFAPIMEGSAPVKIVARDEDVVAGWRTIYLGAYFRVVERVELDR